LRILGVNSTVLNVLSWFYAITIVIYIVRYIYYRVSYGKTVKGFKGVYYYLKESHKARYYCLLRGDTKTAKEFEEIMDMCSETIFKVGPSIIGYKGITEKERKEVKEILEKSKVLLTTTQPPV